MKINKVYNESCLETMSRMDKEYNVIRMENWSIIGIAPHSSPEQCLRIQGEAHGYSEYSDGSRIMSSTIERVDSENELLIGMSGRLYQLGKVNEEYEELFPNAFERIMGVQSG